MLEAATLAVGLGLSAYGMFKGRDAAEAATEADLRRIRLQQAAEGIRRQAMERDAIRRQRQSIREAVAARSMALTRATSQGASGRGSSILEGAYGGISGQTNVNMLGVTQALQDGRKMFGINQQIGDAQMDYSKAKSEESFYQGIGNLGTQLMGSAGNISKVASFAGNAPSYFNQIFNQFNNTGFYGSSGTGLYSNSTGSLY